MATLQGDPYGSWKSPITSTLIASALAQLGEIVLEGTDVYWSESRPIEAGRNVVVRYTRDECLYDMTPAPFDARTLAHEYGGGAYTVSDGTIYFSNFADQRLYRQAPGSTPEPITPSAPLRYADGIVDRSRRRLICVCEDHSSEGETVNTLISVALDSDNAGGTMLVTGNDFYSSPRLSPNGTHLAWLTWNHPNMPWDGTELWVAEFRADGSLFNAQCIAGGTHESIFQPEWSPNGILHFISDRTGWWNLYRWRTRQIEALHLMEAEFGVPQWYFGLSTYGFTSANEIICWYTFEGFEHLARLDTITGVFTPIELPYTSIKAMKVTATQVVFAAASPTEPWSIVRLDLTTGKANVLLCSSNKIVDSGYLSKPELIEFPTEYGVTAYGFFYRPCNRDFVAPKDELPPLIIKSHGGPTLTTSSAFNLTIQFWTSRGFAILDVNYSGSTGYGRAYRQRLNNQWGVVDVNDCVNGALYLSKRDLVDSNRMVIMGVSAGGYTTLCALTFRNVFKAGASYYGVSDLEAIMRDTHKFESHYFYQLIGPYPDQQIAYYERSPIHFTECISCPVIFFQGLEDRVVPPNQAEKMVAALREKGLPVAFITYKDEGHGFRSAESIQSSCEAELYFYSQVLGFPLADPVAHIMIENG